MKILLLILMLMSPLRQVEYSYLQFSTLHRQIFPDYRNDNFQQSISWKRELVSVTSQSLNFYQLDLNFRVVIDRDYLLRQPRDIQETAKLLVGGSMSLRDYVDSISGFLSSKFRYSDNGELQDALSVLTRKTANCVGYSNLVHVLFNCVGVSNRFVKGFYLKNGDGDTLTPIPHKWVEVMLTNGYTFFYDPQHQSFSSGYILVEQDVDFKKIRRFLVTLVKREVKMIN